MEEPMKSAAGVLDDGDSHDSLGDPSDMRDTASFDLPRLLRLSNMMQSLLNEANTVDLGDDAPARRHLAIVQQRALDAIATAVPPDLAQELAQLTEPGAPDPSGGELRVTQSQVVGWLAGLFHAFQVVALEQQLRAAPPRPAIVSGPEVATPGQYL